jgi:hypothetical protein
MPRKQDVCVDGGDMCIQNVNLMVEQKFVALQDIHGTKISQKLP